LKLFKRKKLLIFISFILFCCFILIFYFNKEFRSNHTTIISKLIYSKQAISKYPNIKLLKNGYLIFRRGYGVDSMVASNFSNGEKRYSHAGIIYKENGKIFVIHSEDSKVKNFNGVVKENLKNYLEGIKIWAVYKYKNIDNNKLNEYIVNLQKSNILFDMDFDLKTDNKMYCSEFIYKSFNNISNKEIIKASKIFLSKRYVTISDLYQNHNTRLIDISHSVIVGKK